MIRASSLSRIITSTVARAGPRLRHTQDNRTAVTGVLSDVRSGDFSVRMPLDWTGVAGKAADALNDVIASNQALAAELARVSRVVGKEGKLSHRVAMHGSGETLTAAD